MKGDILIHPDELSSRWIRLAKKTGVGILGIHPVGGQDAVSSLQALTDYAQTPQFRALLEEAHSEGLQIEYEIHAVNWLLNRDLFDSHPEYFRMDEKGERTPDHNLCPSNDDAMNIVAERAADLVRILPSDTHRYYLWMDDVVNGGCQCPKCKSLSASDQQVLVMNRMVRSIRKVDPQAKLAYLGYYACAAAPTAEPDPNLFLEYAPMEKYMISPPDDGLTPLQREERIIRPLLQIFRIEEAKILEYWLDNSMYSGWKKPPKAMQVDAEPVLRDILFYAGIGFRSISTFGCYLGDDYVELHGEPDITPYTDAMRKV